MNNKRYIFYAAAALLLAACAKDGKPAGGEVPVSGFSFQAEWESLPVSKAVLGQNDAGKPKTIWESGDQITVYSNGDGADLSASRAGFAFTTTDATSPATFTYAGDDFADGDYLAIYPAATAKRTVNYTNTETGYRMAAVDVPTEQTLVSGSFDRKVAIAIAYAKKGSTSLSFKNAVALLKFRVADADVTSGSVYVGGGDVISGRYRADINPETTVPTLTVYSTTGVSQSDHVNFSLEGGAALTPGVDYYVAVRPTVIASGLGIILNEKEVKNFTSEQLGELKRNTIYNLGTLSVPSGEVETMTLDFDFTVTPFTGWPTADKYTHKDGGVSCVYPLGGTDYTFVLADCDGAGSARVYWGSGKLVIASYYRYVGLPAISGYKLVEVACTNVSGNKTAVFQIVKSITSSAVHPAASEIVDGGGSQTWSQNAGAVYTYSLRNTAANTMYYLYCRATGGAVSHIALTYEKVN